MMMPFNCQVPQAPTPLLIPPLNQLAQLRAARAPGENAENAQDEVVQGLRMPDQRKITAAIMKAPHIAARALGTDPRGKIMHSRLLTQNMFSAVVIVNESSMGCSQSLQLGVRPRVRGC